ncbi:MAG TPA: adenosine-specific kinase, partial [Candidatus Eisenbacteria bacterium]|nr:adenosine-specific kinase [Candidatus Eisenbacteria bacterium]
MQLTAVPLTIPADCNLVAGQAHFIKTAEDLAEIVATGVPGAAFGLAFCEASGPCLIRTEGNDPALVAAAVDNARRVGAGHTFHLLLRGAFPINVLPAIQQCQEVCQVFCAT